MKTIAAGLTGLMFITGCATSTLDPVPAQPAIADTNVAVAAVAPVAARVAEPAAAGEKPAAPAVASVPPAVAEKPVEKAATTAAAPQETKIKNAAAGATVTASSTMSKYAYELPASALVDGDLTTRWSSEYTEPQTVEVKLQKPLKIARVRLHWEHAVATKYALSISSDGKKWEGMHAYLKTDAKPEPRVDDINLNGVSAQYIKLDLTGRVNPTWGFSLYEVEVVPAN